MDNYTDLMLSCPFHGIALEEMFSPPHAVYYHCSECDRQVRSALQAMNIHFQQRGSNTWCCLDERADEDERMKTGLTVIRQ
jgi:hypothetical protein